MAKYITPINSFHQLSYQEKAVSIRGFKLGKDNFMLSLLLMMLRHLATLELHGSLACLPPIHTLEHTSALSTLRTLKFSSIDDKVISECCRYIIQRPLLRELEFFDISLTFFFMKHIRWLRLPPQSLLRF
jgi:hypothetical protein